MVTVQVCSGLRIMFPYVNARDYLSACTKLSSSDGRTGAGILSQAGSECRKEAHRIYKFVLGQHVVNKKVPSKRAFFKTRSGTAGTSGRAYVKPAVLQKEAQKAILQTVVALMS